MQKKETINIATKPMTEQYIIGEMLDILIEQDTDLNVELTQGVGGGACKKGAPNLLFAGGAAAVM